MRLWIAHLVLCMFLWIFHTKNVKMLTHSIFKPYWRNFRWRTILTSYYLGMCLSLSLFKKIFWRSSWYSFLAALMLAIRSMLVPFYNSGPNMNKIPLSISTAEKKILPNTQGRTGRKNMSNNKGISTWKTFSLVQILNLTTANLFPKLIDSVLFHHCESVY